MLQSCVALKIVVANRPRVTSSLYGKAPPDDQPLFLYTIFDKKGTAFVYLPLKNFTPLTYLLNKNNRQSRKFCCHFRFVINKLKGYSHKARLFSTFQSRVINFSTFSSTSTHDFPI